MIAVKQPWWQQPATTLCLCATLLQKSMWNPWVWPKYFAVTLLYVYTEPDVVLKSSFRSWSAGSCIPKTTPKKLGLEESSRGLVLTSSSLQDSAPVMANVSMAVTRPCLCMLLLANHGMLSPNLLSQTIAVIPLPQTPTDHYLGSMNPWICHSNLLCTTAIAPGGPAIYWVLALSEHGSQAVAYTQMPGIVQK